MPFDIRFENRGRGVIVHWYGDLTGKELIDAIKSVYAQDTGNQIRYLIWDLKKTDRIKLTDDQLRAVALVDRSAAEKNPHQIIAIIGKPEFRTGEETLYKIYSEIWSGFKTRSFLSMEKARSWIASIFPEL